jgi:hypothetical protein
VPGLLVAGQRGEVAGIELQGDREIGQSLAVFTTSQRDERPLVAVVGAVAGVQKNGVEAILKVGLRLMERLMNTPPPSGSSSH